LDANEPGNNKSLISVDNIRIYTSATDNTAAVGAALSVSNPDYANLDGLGTLRWAMNTPTAGSSNGFNVANWVKLDSSQENVLSNANGGSGQADMIVYVPTTAFAGAKATDFLWFYNLNGVHYYADKGMAAQAGYEEWSAVVGPNSQQVPDGGTTVVLVGSALAALGFVSRCRRVA